MKPDACSCVADSIKKRVIGKVRKLMLAVAKIARSPPPPPAPATTEASSMSALPARVASLFSGLVVATAPVDITESRVEEELGRWQVEPLVVMGNVLKYWQR